MPNLERRILRATVLQGARCLLERVLDSIEAEVYAVGYTGGSTEWTIAFETDRTADEVQEAIWAANGGGWCEVRDAADAEVASW